MPFCSAEPSGCHHIQRHLHCFHVWIVGNGFPREYATVESLCTNPFALAFFKGEQIFGQSELT